MNFSSQIKLDAEAKTKTPPRSANDGRPGNPSRYADSDSRGAGIPVTNQRKHRTKMARRASESIDHAAAALAEDRSGCYDVADETLLSVEGCPRFLSDPGFVETSR
jgi:hypothetical protein